jgi:IS4 transposase
MPDTTATRPRSSSNKSRQHCRPGRRRRVQPRRKTGGRPKGSVGTPRWFRRAHERRRAGRDGRPARRAFAVLRRDTLKLISRAEVEGLARECGFYQRTPRAIRAFEFVICCALAAVAEGKRGFASVWRLLAAAVGVEVARSAVTQRFGEASAAMMEKLFTLAVGRLPRPACPEMLSKLERFRAVLADDATVLTLSPLLKKLFPATRTNSVAAAGKLHASVDAVHRRVVRVELTGERTSDLAVARAQPIQPDTLYLEDLGYFSHDRLAEIVAGNGHFLLRLKENSNPRVVGVRHGIRTPAVVVQGGLRLDDLDPTLHMAATRDTFDLDCEFQTQEHGAVVLRVAGQLNAEAGRIHWYVTSLPAEQFSVEELAVLYSLRWVVELLFKTLKSSCHLDHVDTSDPGALRTHLYASLLAATILTALTAAAASVHGLPPGAISPLAVGIAAPLLVMPLALLWCGRRLTPEELADAILRVVGVGCVDQNPNRTRAKWGRLARN